MVYLILVNITLTLCYLLYRLFFKRFTFFQLNRFYLLGTVVLSLVVPVGLFIDISANGFMDEQLPTVDLSSLIAEEFVVGINRDNTTSLGEVLQLIYWGGVSIAIGWMLFRFFRVVSLLRDNHPDFSFAFFHRVVLGEKAEGNQAIVDHELIHVEQGHSYDLLLVELVKAFNWFNPVLRSYLKEVKFQHECIADELCSIDKVAYAELLVAQAMQVKSIHFLHEFSNTSILKNRIVMLFKDKSKRRYKLLYFSIAPVILLAVLSTLIFNTSKAKDLVQNIEDKVEDAKIDNVQKHLSLPFTESGEIVAAVRQQVKLVGTKTDAEPRDTTKLSSKIEVSPEPIGGFERFRSWIGENYVYPKDAIAAKVEGQIVTSFVVETDGSLSEFKIIRDLGHGTGKAAIDLLKKSVKWMPSIKNGEKVRVAFTLPISLKTPQNAAKIILKGSTPASSSKEQSTSSLAVDDNKTIFTAVEVNPEPVGGLNSFRMWLGSNYRYPQEAIDAELKGQMVVSFIVEADGELTDFKVVKDLGYGTADAAIEVLQKAANWRPGIQNGKKVRVAYTLPITFNFQQQS